MFENRRMFDGLDPETSKYGNCFHLASIVGLWDLLPRVLLATRVALSTLIIECLGKIPRNLEASNKKDFLDFIRKMV
ncbi:hypothetical protein LAWI1_G001998 [Lachnellula willkommii]|uniref:Uncharacterized protein n=1 Tax=Lachnellula willkommii TaxID=215461 RepID=A0A559MJT9_9HELO|nr:hypothetical protein LAWI1_G001998 [Lachnellula willkommii]